VYVVLMLTVSWQLTIIATGFVVPMSMMMRFISSGPLRRSGERLSGAMTRVNQVVMESISGMKGVRLASAEPYLTEVYAKALSDMIDSRRRSIRVQYSAAPVLSTCASLLIALLLFGNAVFRVDDPAKWVGSILLFLFLLFRLMGPLTSMNNARN